MPSGVYPREPGAWKGNGGKRRRSPTPKLSPQQVRDVREARASGTRVKVLAHAYGVHPGLINRVLQGQGAYKEMR